MTSPNLSHFYISKKPLLVFQSSANLPNFRLPAPIGQNFERLVMVFLKYINGSNFERSLLSTIQSFVGNPSKMKKILITLLSILPGCLLDTRLKSMMFTFYSKVACHIFRDTHPELSFLVFWAISSSIFNIL